MLRIDKNEKATATATTKQPQVLRLRRSHAARTASLRMTILRRL